MRILLVHNQYQIRGGEDSVFRAESNLLQRHGHDVFEFTKSNDAIGAKASVDVAIGAIWARESYRELRQKIRDTKPAVVHVHNYLPLISPAVFFAAEAEGVPAIQTLHNFRLLCLNGLLMREESICELCVTKSLKWPGVLNKCYRDSYLGSSIIAAMLSIHGKIGTWQTKVTRFIALTEFQREKLLAAGLPDTKIAVKPNFSPDPGYDEEASGSRAGGLFIGRLSHEKGVDVLLDAAGKCDVPIDLAGSGPKLDEIRQLAPPNLRVHGFVENSDLASMKRKALFLALPSIVYEGFPMVIAEAFAAGLPVIASRHGGMKEIVKDGETGLHFNPGDSDDLAAMIRWAAENPEKMQAMGRKARQTYENEFSPEQNVKQLVQIYQNAVDEVASRDLC